MGIFMKVGQNYMTIFSPDAFALPLVAHPTCTYLFFAIVIVNVIAVNS